MTSETVTTMSIEIPHPPDVDENFLTALSQLFDALADRVFMWAEDKNLDTMVTAVTKDADSESHPILDPPPTKPLVREADSKSMHEITIVDLLGEILVICDTCHDELGAKVEEISLREILWCVDLHRNGPPDID